MVVVNIAKVLNPEEGFRMLVYFKLLTALPSAKLCVHDKTNITYSTATK